ncbi:MAG: hypothetical protein E2P06_04115 [Acidobacteria bacterium]|nr:MAG: hypothetical protein E2P06_04115 [Acidobacteriota bacterium]
MTGATKAVSAAIALVVTLTVVPGRAVAQCPSWEDMLAEGSLVQIEAILRDEIDLTLSLVYLNPPRLGSCALGEALFEGLDSNLLSAGPPVQAFWVGVSGRSADQFSPEQLWVVQGEKELGLSLKAEFDTETRLGRMIEFAAEYIVFYNDEIDRSLPMRLIYISSIGPVSEVYRLDAAYR